MAMLGLQPLKFAIITVRLSFGSFGPCSQVKASLMKFGAIVRAGLRLICAKLPGLCAQPPVLDM
jgi:hypothetical protein